MSKQEEKKIPKDVKDIFCSVRVGVEQQLTEAEGFITSANGKTFDMVLTTLNETTNLIEKFVESKSTTLEKVVDSEKRSVNSMTTALQSILVIQSKLQGVDKSKELVVFGQRCTDELRQEVVKLFLL